MINIDIKFPVFKLNLSIEFGNAEKRRLKAEKRNNSHQEDSIDEIEVKELKTEEYENNAHFIFDEDMDAVARQFKEDLEKTPNGVLYDIPYDSDLPSKLAIEDDVEVITDKFEKEIDDIRNGIR